MITEYMNNNLGIESILFIVVLICTFFRERIVQVIAIMVKRQSVEDGGVDRGVVINEVQQLITSGNQQMQMTGCAIITALMQEQEYSSSQTTVIDIIR